jgi:hypothetical protein
MERKNEQRAGIDFQSPAIPVDQSQVAPLNGTPFPNVDYADNVMSSIKDDK